MTSPEPSAFGDNSHFSQYQLPLVLPHLLIVLAKPESLMLSTIWVRAIYAHRTPNVSQLEKQQEGCPDETRLVILARV